jgi:hypothetical protein
LSFLALLPCVWSVNVVPLVIARRALGPFASLIAQKYELAELNAAEPVSVTVLGPFVFAILNVPVTTCCVSRSVPPAS